MAVHEFDRSTARRVSELAQQVVAAAVRELGLEVQAAGGRFDRREFTLKLKVRVPVNDMQQFEEEAAQQASFQRWAHSMGLPAEVYGRAFAYRGNTYKVAGVNANRPKYPVVAVRQDGKRFKFSAEIVRRCMNLDEDGRLRSGFVA